MRDGRRHVGQSAADGVGGKHEPISVGITRVGAPGGGDIEGLGTLLDDGPAVVAAQERGVAPRFHWNGRDADDGVSIEIQLEAGFDG